MTGIDFPVISADSHITEAPDTYTAYIDAKWRDKAPHVVRSEEKGDMFVIPSWVQWSLAAETQFDLFRFSDAPIIERLHFNRTFVDGVER